MNAPVLLGIDLGGTKIEIIALDAKGNSLYRTRTHTPRHNDAERQYQNILDAIQHLVQQCEANLGISPAPLGIGIPGSESLKTGLIKNANTVCLINRPLRDDLSNLLARPVLLENDANCFALSEAIDGAGQKYQSVFAVILGTGVGGGWVINKQLIIGPNHICGEWGHNPLPWSQAADEPKQTCYCGKLGCIETYLSGPGFTQQSQLQLAQALIDSKEPIKPFDSHTLMALKASHPIAQLAYEQYVDRLAKSLASVINIMDPDAIVLGGGLSNVASLYEDVPKAWGKYAFSDALNTPLLKNQYGDSSGVRGAAWLNHSQLKPSAIC